MPINMPPIIATGLWPLNMQASISGPQVNMHGAEIWQP
jgi:hypothetical protein